MSIKVTLDQSKEWDLQVSELTQLADDSPTPDDFGDVQIQMICQRAAEWGFAQAVQPSQAGEPDASAKTWCEYVAGMVGCYLGEPVESDKCKAIAAIIFRRLWALPLQMPSQAGEPVVYQSRMRPLWGQSLWTEWSNCTKGMHDDYKKTPILNDWEFEARALSVTPQTAVQPSQAGERAYISPVRTVADLANNLLMMDQTLPIYGAQYIEHAGKRRCIAVPPTVSRERIKDSRWIGEGDELNAAVIWTRAERPSQAALSSADVWTNKEIMALNAEAGLEMSLLMKIVNAAINAKESGK